MTPALFFRNLTCLDFGYIDNRGKVRGESFHVSVSVRGQVSKEESVILDFSAGKKKIKNIIDDMETGYDHKLLVFSFSDVTYISPASSYCNKNVIIKTPLLEAFIPKNAVRVCTSSNSNMILAIEEDLELLLKANLPEFDFNVSLSELGFSEVGPTYFNYSHGLKSSTSLGCQNIFHGHASFIEVTDKEGSFDDSLAESIKYLFHNKVLVFKENIVESRQGYTLIKVDTKDRGVMSCLYSGHDVLILDTETTIEFMAQHVIQNLGDKLKGYTVSISEGLQKGITFTC